MSTTDNPGGIAVSHPELEMFDIPVAPSAGKEKNTIRMELQPVACWKTNDTRFDFGSSFVRPESKPEFKELQPLREGNAGTPLLLFGHADPKRPPVRIDFRGFEKPPDATGNPVQRLRAGPGCFLSYSPTSIGSA